MRSNHRNTILCVVLGGIVALIFWRSGDEQHVTASSPIASALPQDPGAVAGKAADDKSGGAQSFAFALPVRTALGEPYAQLFAVQSWQAAAPSLAPAEIVTPGAPPLPFRYAGRLSRNGRMQFFLSKGDIPFPIKESEVLDGTYRVDSIREDRIVLVYLPLGQEISIIPLKASAADGATLPGGAGFAGPGAAPAVAGLKADGKLARLLWVGPQRAKLGSDFSVTLRLMSDEPVRASPIHLRFDPAVLEAVAVRLGRFFGPEGTQGSSYRVNPDGSILVGASPAATAPASDGEFVVLTFKPIKPSVVAEISVASLSLQGAAGRAIEHEAFTAFRIPVLP